MKYKIGDRVYKFDGFTYIIQNGKTMKEIEIKIGIIRKIIDNHYYIKWFDFCTDFPNENLYEEDENYLYPNADDLVKDIRKQYATA